jgi:hypothetical protein
LGRGQQSPYSSDGGLAIEWLKHASQKAVAEQPRLSWDEIHGIMERALEHGLAQRKAEKISYLGVDARPNLLFHSKRTPGRASEKALASSAQNLVLGEMSKHISLRPVLVPLRSARVAGTYL